MFGSFANGTNTENSDFDFYIVVDDKVTDLVGMTASVYKAIRATKQWLDMADMDMGFAQHLMENYYPKPLEIIC